MADIKRGLKAGAAVWLIIAPFFCVLLLLSSGGFSSVVSLMYLLLPSLPFLMISGIIFAIFYDKMPTKSSLVKGTVLFLIPVILFNLNLFLIKSSYYYLILSYHVVTALAVPLHIIISLINTIHVPIDLLPILGLSLGFFWDKFETKESSIQETGGLFGFFKKNSWVIVPVLLSFSILAVVVAIPIINPTICYGYLCPAPTLPEKCTFPVSLICLDHSVTPTYVALSLQNGAGRDMNIQRISVSSDALGTSVNLGCGCYAAPANNDGILKNDATAAFTLKTPDPGCPNWCNYKDTGRDKNRYNITVFYRWADDPTVIRTLPGELLAKRH